MNLTDQVRALLEEAIERHELPCGNVLVLKDGKELLYAEAGCDLATGEPVRRDTIFRLYSQTKPITAAATAMLMERGALELSAPVAEFLPGFSDQKVIRPDGGFENASRPVTVMDLLGMCAGLSYPGDDAAGRFAADLFDENTAAMKAGNGLDTVGFCNAIGRLPLAFQPGCAFRYSTCADVLGAIVEVVSGMPFSEFLRREFFEPLGMKDTAFWVPEEKRSRFVTCAKRVPGGLEPFAQLHLCVGDYSKPPRFESGGAGLVSTLDDYARFAAMLLRKGELDGRRYLSEQTVAWLTAPQLPEGLFWDCGGGWNYGKLMRICTEPGRFSGLARAGEYGWDGWLGTYFTNMPDIGMTILLNQNVTDTGFSRLTRRVRNVVLSGT